MLVPTPFDSTPSPSLLRFFTGRAREYKLVQDEGRGQARSFHVESGNGEAEHTSTSARYRAISKKDALRLPACASSKLSALVFLPACPEGSGSIVASVSVSDAVKMGVIADKGEVEAPDTTPPGSPGVFEQGDPFALCGWESTPPRRASCAAQVQLQPSREAISLGPLLRSHSHHPAPVTPSPMQSPS